MKYRLAVEDDRQAIKQFCVERNEPEPDYGITLVATEDDGKIVAVANGGIVPYIETCISDSPMATLVVLAMLEGSLGVTLPNAIVTLATVKSEEAEKILVKHGFRESGCALFIRRR